MSVYFTKRVYDPPEAQDGCRLIVMRRYPRGVAKSRAHGWIPQLAPSLPLVHWYHENLRALVAQWQSRDSARYESELAKFWKVYRGRYLKEMRAQRSLIEFLASLHCDFGVTLTLLCGCRDHRICHRSLLARLIEAPA